MTESATATAQLKASIETRRMRKFLDAVLTTRSTCKLSIDDDEIRITSIDLGNVHVVDAALPASVFESFDAHPGSVGFDARGVHTVLDRSDRDRITLDISEEGIRLPECSGSDEVRRVLLKEVPDPSVNVTKISEGLTATVTVTGLEFKDLADPPGDAEVLEFATAAEPTEVVVQGLDEDNELVDLLEIFDEDSAQELRVDELGSSRFHFDYLSEIAQSITASPPVEIGFAEGWPLRIRYPLVGVWSDDERAIVCHYVAPRIPPEDR